MSEFRIVHQGFDKLDVAFTGGLSGDLFPLLNALKEKAQRENEAQLAELGPAAHPVHVHDRGMRGGYAFRLNTGPLGANFFVKENFNLTEWNLFMASQAEGLLAFGLNSYFTHCRAELRAMGATVNLESVNRVDYAVDFACPRLDLRPEQFVCPPRTKSRVFYGDGQYHDDLAPVVLTCGRRVESVTIGRMPGRQLIVYNKGAEALQRNKRYWFERWGLDPRHSDIEVWRAELRAGKHHLKEDYGLSKYSDLEDSIGDVFKKMIRDIRYLSDERSDSNVTRAGVHPFWSALEAAIASGLNRNQSGLAPGRIIEIERQALLDRCADNIAGNALSYAGARGLSVHEVGSDLPAVVAAILRARFDQCPQKVQEKLERVRKRYRFLEAK